MANDEMMTRRNNWAEDPFFNDLGRRFFGPVGDWFDDFDRGVGATAMNGLPTDVKETKDSYQLKVDVPGVDKKDIKLSYKDHVLTVAVTKKEIDDHTDKDGNLIMSERTTGATSRSYQLPNVDAQHIDAQYTAGVLTVKLPKLTEITDSDNHIEIK